MPSGTNSLVRSDARSAVLPKTPEQFAYDLDGNLLQDGLWTNSWNGENRLISMQSLPAVPDSMKKRLDFAYDYMGRRTTKKSLSGYSGGTYSTTNTTTFVWDGWLPIAEISNSGSQITTNFYTWVLTFLARCKERAA